MVKKLIKYKIQKQILRWLLLFIILIVPKIQFGQTYSTRNYTVYDGLPSSAIRCIYKDSHGLLWIGNDASLCTFDGKAFQIVKTTQGKTINQVWSIAEDDQGNMWFGSHGEGVYKYDGRHIEKFTKKNGLADDYVRVVTYSNNFQCVVAGSYKGISIIKNDTIITSPEWMGKREKMYCVTGIAEADKFLYVSTFGKINPIRCYPDKGEFISLSNSGKYPNGCLDVYITSKGDTVFSLYPKGIKIIGKKGTIEDFSLGQVFNMTEDNSGNIWFASWSTHNRDLQEGVFKYDGKTFKNYKTEFGITDKEIWTVYYDRDQDILWVGTLNEGIFRVSNSEIAKFSPSYFNLEQLKINGLYIDSDDKLWISDNRELFCMGADGHFSSPDKYSMIHPFQEYWRETNRKVYSQMDSVQVKLRKLDKKHFSSFISKNNFEFQMVTNDIENTIIFSNRFGIFSYNQQNSKIDYWGPDGSEGEFALMGMDTLILSGNGPLAFNPMFRDKSANISNTTVSRSNLFYPTNVLFPFTTNGDPKDVNRMVRHKNHFWYATYTTGLWMGDGKEMTNFNKTDTTIGNNINDICFDENDRVIFGSNTGEICIATYLNKELKIDYRITSDNGLWGNTINWLVADQKGHLWAGTNLGLNFIDLRELYKSGQHRIRFIDKEDGYNGHSSRKAVMDSFGNLFIASDNELLKINTNALLSQPEENQSIILKSFEVNQQPFDSIFRDSYSSSTPSKKLKLHYYEKNLVFGFDILNYKNPHKDSFRFKLDGFDKEWTHWSENRNAVYTNLSPGRYKFIVESLNLGDLQQAEPLTIEFTIRSPFWKLWYLQVLFAIILLVSAVLITKKLMDNERFKQLKKTEIEKKMLQLEMQALQAQMNPHFIFNCVSGIQYHVLANKMDEVLKYLSDFSKVVRVSFENVSLSMIPLDHEIDFLNSYLRLEQMRFEDKFEYNIQNLTEGKKGAILLPPMMVQPFAENSIKHGFNNLTRKGNLSIVFEAIEIDVLKCTIIDNGIGRQKPMTQKGMNDKPHGTVITETRLGLYNQPSSPEKYKIVNTDFVKKENMSGLKVEIYLPISYSFAKDS